ncbi:ABC transporter permease [Spirosoma aerolatum]|uniref:ABC transporter permease n=1 Tax=Spirosoma aerolatum TaxID=1211326 RepID=UPI0009AD39DF|nr:ABC transporter permease [Spirosoma aerolatum]
MPNTPPRLADRLLTWFCAPHLREEVLGDLHERYAIRVKRRGEKRANGRYWLDVLAYVRPEFIKRKPTAGMPYHRRFGEYPNPAMTTMLRSYLTIALRTLLKNKGYSAINSIGLALGIACCMAIGLYVVDEWQYDRFHANFNRIYRVVEHQKQADGMYNVAVTPGPLAPTLNKDFPEVEQTVRIGRWSGTVGYKQKVAEATDMLIVDPSFFRVFDFPLVAGNAQKALSSPNEIVISERMAERLFGPNWAQQPIIGQPIDFTKDDHFTLVGVAENPPVRSHLQFDVLLPYKWLEKTDEWSQKWNSNNYHTYILLKPALADASADLARFETKLSGQLKHYQSDTENTLYLQPLRDIYLRSVFDFQTDWGQRSDILYVRIFLAVGFIVLLIAIVNFMNLATARASQRAREVGVRKTIGAKRSGLILQFLGESLLMTSLAVGISLVLLQTSMPLFNDLTAKSLELPLREPIFWLALFGLTLVVSLLTGLYPAFFLSSFRPVQVLKGTVNSLGLSVRSGRRFRQSLVVGQFTLAIALAIGSVVIYRQLAFIQDKKLGFDQSKLLYVRMKGDLRFNALRLKREVEKLPGVARVSATTSNLIDITNSSNIEWEGQQPNDAFLITNMNVDADFVSATGMQLAAGRNFSWRVPSDTSSSMGAFLINETAAKRMGWTPEQAIGKRIRFWGPLGRVVGVLKDFHFRPLRVSIEPFLFRFRPDNPYFNMLVKTAPGASAERVIAGLSAAYKKYEPLSSFQFGFVDQDLDAQYRTEQRTGCIILYFSILSIFVSCLGLFGLVAFTAEQRTKEIGVRKVLGASVASIVTLLSKDFLKLVFVAIVLACPMAWYAMNRWLQDFAYRIDIEWWMFALAGLLSVTIALLTVSFQSVKAALMNPVQSLRSE